MILPQGLEADATILALAHTAAESAKVLTADFDLVLAASKTVAVQFDNRTRFVSPLTQTANFASAAANASNRAENLEKDLKLATLKVKHAARTVASERAKVCDCQLWGS